MVPMLIETSIHSGSVVRPQTRELRALMTEAQNPDDTLTWKVHFPPALFLGRNLGKASVTVSSFAACQKYQGARFCQLTAHNWAVFTSSLIGSSSLQSLLASLRCSLGWYMEGCCTPRFMDHDPETVETASFIFWMALELIGVKLAWKWSKQFLPSFLWFPLKFISVFCQNNGNRVSLTPALTIA